MRALLCNSFGPIDNLELAEIDAPTPNAGEVVVDVYSASVNFPDALIVQGKYQFRPPFPFSPGSEAAGVISAVGEGVTERSVGDRVLVMSGNGAFREQIAVEWHRTVSIPDDVHFDHAASLMMTYGTTQHALVQRGNLQPGETLLVTGAGGGVGISAVELGKIMGARVIAAASSEEKLELARKAGADECINYSDGELKDKVKALTNGQGADVIYEVLGGDICQQCMRCINWKGRLLIIGFTTGEIPKIPTNLALLKGCDIVGVFWGSFTGREPEVHAENTRQLLDYLKSGKIKPAITATYPLERAKEAIQALADRTVAGKLVVRVRDE